MNICQGRPWGLVVYQYTWKQTISPQIHAKCKNFENKVNIISMKGSIVASECRILDLSLHVYRIPNLICVVHKPSVYVWRLVWYCTKSNIGNILKDNTKYARSNRKPASTTHKQLEAQVHCYFSAFFAWSNIFLWVFTDFNFRASVCWQRGIVRRKIYTFRHLTQKQDIKENSSCNCRQIRTDRAGIFRLKAEV